MTMKGVTMKGVVIMERGVIMEKGVAINGVHTGFTVTLEATETPGQGD